MRRLGAIALLSICGLLPACRRGSTTLVLRELGYTDASALSTPVLTRPKTHGGDDTKTVARIELRADGTTWFNGVVAGDDRALTAAARGVVSKEPNVTGEITADPAVPYARVIHAQDVLRAAGLSDVAFTAAEPTPTPRGH